MIISFKSKGTRDIFHGISSKESRKIPKAIWRVCQRKLDMLNAAVSIKDLKIPPANKLKVLKGDLNGFYSIRVNDQYRIIFHFENGNVYDVEITDYH